MSKLNKAQEKRLVIRQILEMRFGDGSGKPNLQIDLATKEIMVELSKQKKDVVKELEKMQRTNFKYWSGEKIGGYLDAIDQAIKTIKEL